MNHSTKFAGGIAALLALTGCGSGEPEPSPLEEAYDECHSANWGGMDYDPDYDVMTFHRVYEQEDGEVTDDGRHHALSWECAQSEIGIPNHVLSNIESTTAMQGRQGAEWDEYSASWTYHPNNGINLTLERGSDD